MGGGEVISIPELTMAADKVIFNTFRIIQVG